tara:strand:- start:335 stop:496 length:162 start_codon:yes stop_codon:yes gene_type:complete
MLRWFLIGILLYGIGTGLRDGWMVIHWSHFLNSIGFTNVDPQKPFNLEDYIFN